MEEPTNEDANPMKSVEDEPISEHLERMAKQKAEGEPIPPEAAGPGTGKMSEEMQLELKRLLRGTNRGRALMAHLDSLARPDLYKNSVNVNWVKDIQAVDVSVQPFDLNPGIFERFRGYCWNNAMTFRFDDTSGKLILLVRWFLPDVLPIMDPNLNAMAMKAPIPPEAKPDLKEVK